MARERDLQPLRRRSGRIVAQPSDTGSGGAPRPSCPAGRPSVRGRRTTRSGDSRRRRRGRRWSASGRGPPKPGRSDPRGAGRRRRNHRARRSTAARSCADSDRRWRRSPGVCASRTSSSPTVTRRREPGGRSSTSRTRRRGAPSVPGARRGRGRRTGRVWRSIAIMLAALDERRPRWGPPGPVEAEEERWVRRPGRSSLARGRAVARGTGRRRVAGRGRRVAPAPSWTGGGVRASSKRRRPRRRRRDAEPEGLGDTEAEGLVDPREHRVDHRPSSARWPQIAFRCRRHRSTG